MRHAVLVLALIGAVPVAGLGVIWLGTSEASKEIARGNRARFNDPNEQAARKLMLMLDPTERARQQQELDRINEQEYEIVYRRGRTYPFLLGAAVLAVLAGALAELRQGFAAALLLTAAVAGPAIVHPWTLCASFVLIVAVPLALFIPAGTLDDTTSSRRRSNDERRRRPRDDEFEEDEDDREPRRRPADRIRRRSYEDEE
jgi:hypothetical protein